jgi:large subunit ribosomal protein L32e
MKQALALRKKIKAKKPTFVSQDSHKRRRIKIRWNKPRGYQSKIRLHKRGYRKMVSTGYGSPKSVHGLHPSGLKSITVNSLSDLKNINKENQGILISGSVGNKKRLEIINKAKETGIAILNFKEVDKFVKKTEAALAKRKEEKAKKEERKKAAEKKKPVKKEEKPKLSEKLSEEEKKEEEKKKKDKVLTKAEK